MKKLGVALLVLVSLSCGRTKKAEAPPQRGVAHLPWMDTLAYPLADGGAYLVTNAGQEVSVYYLRGDEAMPVGNISLRDDAVIFPLVDGPAYLIGSRDEKSVVYFLSKGTAREVRDVKELSSSAEPLHQSGAALAWVTLQAERARRIHAAREKAAEEDAMREQ